MAKKHGWRALNALACVSLWLCGGCMPSGPVTVVAKASPDGEWSVTVWRDDRKLKAWAEVHDSTLDRTVEVDLSRNEDWDSNSNFTRLVIDNDSAVIGSQHLFDIKPNDPEYGVYKKIVRREVFREKPPRAPRYSGEFEVVSDFPETIQIVSWSDDFGRARPPKGAIAPRKAYGSDYLWLKEVPDSISVEWYPESDPDHHRQQTIFMVGVTPVNQKGRTAFHLDRDGKWSVRFVHPAP